MVSSVKHQYLGVGAVPLDLRHPEVTEAEGVCKVTKVYLPHHRGGKNQRIPEGDLLLLHLDF